MTEEERPLHGPARPDGGLFQAAAGQLHEMFGVHRQLDHVLHESAKRVGGVEFESIFNPISAEKIAATPRMDAINHDQVFLRSSPLSAAETEAALGLLEILHGDFATPNIEAFAEFTEREKFFERLADGQSFIFVGSHLEFQDVGFNLGYLTRAAQRKGFDRLDTRTTLMIGRLLGYLEVMGLNVIDDILRKAANVLKTFPVSGGEAVNEGDITDEDLNRRVKGFRKRQNARTRAEFMNLMTSDHGNIVIEAGSGSRDAKDAHGYVVMEPFATGTREDLYLAARGSGDLSHLRRLRRSRRAEHRCLRSGDQSHRQPEARARDRRDDREHGQPRARRRVARAPRRRPLPDPDPIRQLRELGERGTELRAGERQLARIDDRVQVVDQSVARLERQHDDELVAPEGEHPRIAVDRLRHERHVRLGSEELEQVGCDVVAPVNRRVRHTGSEVGVTDRVGVEKLDERVDVAAGAHRDEPLHDLLLHAQVRLETIRPGFRLDAMPGPTRELATRGGCAVDDRADRVEGELKDVV